jgi:hypothetical protein
MVRQTVGAFTVFKESTARRVLETTTASGIGSARRLCAVKRLLYDLACSMRVVPSRISEAVAHPNANVVPSTACPCFGAHQELSIMLCTT